ncbi:hypothetical protein VIGAN_09081300 [Vigna angularis var. angularis]|uniref:Uncharacterized protein n=1 Tax=Vigna angularis var. angularis TaxID=157739 RepID=A0A0S3SWU4_PHAAN|nr:hypothetical protein VIGAN_09081300 [Vigna angularis var. angularis]
MIIVDKWHKQLQTIKTISIKHFRPKLDKYCTLKVTHKVSCGNVSKSKLIATQITVIVMKRPNMTILWTFPIICKNMVLWTISKSSIKNHFFNEIYDTISNFIYRV